MGQISGPGNGLVDCGGQGLLNGDGQAADGFQQAGDNEEADKGCHQQHHQIGQQYSQRAAELLPDFPLAAGQGPESDVLKKVDKHVKDIGNDKPAEYRGHSPQQGAARGPDMLKAQHRQHSQGGKGNQQAARAQDGVKARLFCLHGELLLPSGFGLEDAAAVLAGDLNFPPAPGRPQLLAAGRAFEVFIGFALGKFLLLQAESALHRAIPF